MGREEGAFGEERSPYGKQRVFDRVGRDPIKRRRESRQGQKRTSTKRKNLKDPNKDRGDPNRGKRGRVGKQGYEGAPIGSKGGSYK
jgi:hypothetical protein